MNSLNQEAAEILETAADLYESGALEWIAGREDSVDQISGQKFACAFGAAKTARNINAHRLIAFHRAGEVVYKKLPPEVKKPLPAHYVANWNEVIYWNDQTLPGQAAVVEVFKLAAKDLRNGEETP